MSSSKPRRRRQSATSELGPANPVERPDRSVPVSSHSSLHPSADPASADADPTASGLTPDVTEEDLDDSVFFRRRESRRASPRHAHKDHQLCAQVAALVGAALAELEDPWLSCLNVATVAPAPDASRLLVTVVDPDQHPADEVIARLFRLRGHLRSEVAVGITRKRAPELAFAVAVSEEEP
jgi:ribosome-binding factor A